MKQMPNYVKFLKDVLTNRRKFEEFKVVELNEELCNIEKQYPTKRERLRFLHYSRINLRKGTR